ncbi:MAG: ATP-binding protein [Gammaproteobacteria bacterium]|nr:ATP-binding protein [Gammaproteobacteria bacterium]
MHNLHRLIVLRNFTILGQVIVVITAHEFFKMAIPLWPLVGVICTYGVVNLIAWLKQKKHAEINSRIFFLHLVIDVLVLMALLFLTGGANNPFVSLLLLPLVIAATSLNRSYAWVMSLLCLSSYTLLMFFYVPLPHVHLSDTEFMNFHVFGMWVSFLVGVSLIAFFVVKLAEAIRLRDQALADAQARALQDEHLIALGTFAAGAAHELGTPLSTMAVITNELSQHADQDKDKELKEYTQILRDQVDRCKKTLTQLSARAGQSRAEGGRSQGLQNFLDEVLLHWKNMRPSVHMEKTITPYDCDLYIMADATLAQAITNILNNAADASPDYVAFQAHWDQHNLYLKIVDQGDGFVATSIDALGQEFFTTKKEGHGIGLFLAQAVFERLGGEMKIENQDQGGACVSVRLPLAALITKTSE